MLFRSVDRALGALSFLWDGDSVDVDRQTDWQDIDGSWRSTGRLDSGPQTSLWPSDRSFYPEIAKNLGLFQRSHRTETEAWLGGP